MRFSINKEGYVMAFYKQRTSNAYLNEDLPPKEQTFALDLQKKAANYQPSVPNQQSQEIIDTQEIREGSPIPTEPLPEKKESSYDPELLKRSAVARYLLRNEKSGWERKLATFIGAIGAGVAGENPRHIIKHIQNSFKEGLNDATLEDLHNPRSEVSSSYRDLAKNINPMYKPSNTDSAAFLEKKFPWMDRVVGRDLQEKQLLIKQYIAERKGLKGSGVNENHVQKFQKSIGQLATIGNALNEVEAVLGAPLEDIDPNKADIAGINIPVLGRQEWTSSKARELKSAMSTIMNMTLKERSGAAVTMPELKRLQNEFGLLSFNSEADYIKALKRVKRAIRLDMQNIEAGFTPSVVDTYKNRTGFSSEDLNTSQISDEHKAKLKRIQELENIK